MEPALVESSSTGTWVIASDILQRKYFYGVINTLEDIGLSKPNWLKNCLFRTRSNGSILNPAESDPTVI